MGAMPLPDIRCDGKLSTTEGAPVTGRGTLPAVVRWVLPGVLSFQLLPFFRGTALPKGRNLPAAATPRPSPGSALCSLGAQDPCGAGVHRSPAEPGDPLSRFALGGWEELGGSGQRITPPGGRKEESLLCYFVNARWSSILSSLHLKTLRDQTPSTPALEPLCLCVAVS